MINGTPSQEFKMNLQLFAEGETTETATETQTTSGEVATETQTTGTEQQATTEQPKIKVKFNHQDMELPYEEAVTHIQKGMNYDKAVERAKQEARDEYIASQGYTWNDKPITTEAEYKQALLESEMYKKYQEQGLPEEVIAELVESKKFREEAKNEKQTKAQQEKQQSEYIEFLDYFKAKNGRGFDTEKDVIPQEVWLLTANGKTLTDAYIIHRANELETKLKAFETNKSNGESSTGSVTGNGPAKNVTLTPEMIENMTDKERMTHWKEIKKVLGMK